MDALNVTAEVGVEYQTDRVWIDPAVPANKYRVFRKIVDTGALPNATGKSVAHGITGMAVTKFMRAEIWATDGSTKGRASMGDPLVEVTATNIVITATANLSTYTASTVELFYVKTAVLV